MTYADQGTLADRLEVEELTTRQALEVVRQVAPGLQALHDRDILHRDVKPANVLFRTADRDLRATVGDLGLGKALDISSRLTMVAGTPSFVAPEQAQAEPLDARADPYSLVSAPGTAPSASGAEGVFLGLLPGDSLPSAGEAVPARP
jgi:serine/threonine protein kinase